MSDLSNCVEHSCTICRDFKTNSLKEVTKHVKDCPRGTGGKLSFTCQKCLAKMVLTISGFQRHLKDCHGKVDEMPMFAPSQFQPMPTSAFQPMPTSAFQQMPGPMTGPSMPPRPMVFDPIHGWQPFNY